jgi:hypothetical protein
MPGQGGVANTNVEGMEFLSMQDIDRISKELILPSLNMTKSTNFNPNQVTYASPPGDNPLKAAGSVLIGGVKSGGGLMDSPYTQNNDYGSQIKQQVHSSLSSAN